MPHPQRPIEDEATFRTDEQAGTPTDQYKRSEKEFDPANPPTTQPTKNKDLAKRYRQSETLRTDAEESPSQAVRDAYTDS